MSKVKLQVQLTEELLYNREHTQNRYFSLSKDDILFSESITVTFSFKKGTIKKRNYFKRIKVTS